MTETINKALGLLIEEAKRNYATEVVAETVDFLDRGKEGGNNFEDGFTPVEGEDDLPF